MTPLTGGIIRPPRCPIVCFSHLKWDNRLFQRPHQIMLRLARMGHPVYYFACAGFQEQRHQSPLQPDPSIPLYVYALSFSPQVKRFYGVRRWIAGLRVAVVLAGRRVFKPVLWFYHPALFPLGYSHNDSGIVYDVMDHFPSFKENVDDLHFDELAILAESDVVFTGGKSLFHHITEMYEELYHGSISQKMTQVTCMPSGVDYNHFSPHTAISERLHEFPKPRFGYMGAIDERIDWDILRHLAGSTTGSVLLIGPVIGPLPQLLPANLHILGAAEYLTLPSMIAALDVCLIPFIMSPLVQFVSPTKTPEYLAAGKPVVSTPIPDVINDYGSVVTVVKTASEFTKSCLEVAAAPPASEELVAYAQTHANSWNDVAAKMQQIIFPACNSK